MHTKKELDQRLLEAGVRPLKNLGQNFLVNPKICSEIVKAVEKFLPATVVEVGPGLGALTDEFLQPATDGKNELYLVELDAGLVEYWQKKAPQAKIIHRDALKINWEEIIFQKPAVLVSNLPYSIAASIVVELSALPAKVFDTLILMFQKEVAERIAALPGDEDYGMLSVMAQIRWKIDRLIDAGPQDFFPVPNVGSRVLVFNFKEDVNAADEILTFVKLAFSQRRKKLVSNLGASYDKAVTAQFLQQLGHGPDVRAQELSPRQFVNLFSLLNSKKE